MAEVKDLENLEQEQASPAAAGTAAEIPPAEGAPAEGGASPEKTRMGLKQR